MSDCRRKSEIHFECHFVWKLGAHPRDTEFHGCVCVCQKVVHIHILHIKMQYKNVLRNIACPIKTPLTSLENSWKELTRLLRACPFSECQCYVTFTFQRRMALKKKNLLLFHISKFPDAFWKLPSTENPVKYIKNCLISTSFKTAASYSSKKVWNNSEYSTTKNVDSWNFNVNFSYFLQSVHILSNYFGKYICFSTCRITASCHFHFEENYLNFRFGTCQKTKHSKQNKRWWREGGRESYPWILLSKFQAVTQNDRQCFQSRTSCQQDRRRKASCKATSPDIIDLILISPCKMDCSRKITYKHLTTLSPQSPVRNFHTGPSNMSLSYRPCLTD